MQEEKKIEAISLYELKCTDENKLVYKWYFLKFGFAIGF